MKDTSTKAQWMRVAEEAISDAGEWKRKARQLQATLAKARDALCDLNQSEEDEGALLNEIDKALES